MRKLIATTLVTAGLAAGVPAALAQTETAAADPAGAPVAQRQFERKPAMTMAERVEARLAYIRTALKITSAQQSQWDAYANVRRKHVAAMEKTFQERRAQMEQRRTEGKSPTAVERHEFARTRMAAATQRLDELLAVEKPLYAALTPEQQRVADEVLSERGGRRHGGHHRGGRFGRA
jgi:hypothetical protein